MRRWIPTATRQTLPASSIGFQRKALVTTCSDRATPICQDPQKGQRPNSRSTKSCTPFWMSSIPGCRGTHAKPHATHSRTPTGTHGTSAGPQRAPSKRLVQRRSSLSLTPIRSLPPCCTGRAPTPWETRGPRQRGGRSSAPERRKRPAQGGHPWFCRRSNLRPTRQPTSYGEWARPLARAGGLPRAERHGAAWLGHAVGCRL
jgi:hypothetical protein